MTRLGFGVVALTVVMTWSAPLDAQRGAAGGDAQSWLNRTADAILGLKSTRFSLEREGAPAFFDERNGIVFSLAECLYAAPDRASCNIKVSFRNGVLQVVRVWVPEGTFQSNPLTQQFARLPADSSFNGAVLFARTGIPDILRTAVRRPTVVGKESVGNRETLHLAGEVSGERLSALIGSLAPATAYPVDLWIEERSGMPVQLRITESPGNRWLIKLSGTNEPITIPTPQVPAATANP